MSCLNCSIAMSYLQCNHIQDRQIPEASCFNGFKNVDIIQFTCAGLFPSRVICNVVVINTVDIAGCIADNIALCNLLVVDIEDELHIRAANLIDNVDRFV